MLRFLVPALLLACLGMPAFAQVTFQDSTMADADWGIELVGLGDSTGVQVPFGNPGTGRQVTVTVAQGLGNSLRAWHKFGTTQATTFNPPTQGAIPLLQFSIDYLTLSGPGHGQGLAIALKQGSVIYYASPLLPTIENAWRTHAGSVTAANFVRADGLAGTPDFSASGARIRFGFLAFGNADPSGAGHQSESVYDNFLVQVVPAPGPAFLLAGVAGLAAARRRS